MGLIIHHLSKSGNISTNIFSQGGSGPVIGAKHHEIVQLVYGNPFSGMKRGGFHVGCMMTYRYDMSWMIFFQGKQ